MLYSHTHSRNIIAYIPIPAYSLAMEHISTVQFLKIREITQNEKNDHFP